VVAGDQTVWALGAEGKVNGARRMRGIALRVGRVRLGGVSGDELTGTGGGFLREGQAGHLYEGLASMCV